MNNAKNIMYNELQFSYKPPTARNTEIAGGGGPLTAVLVVSIVLDPIQIRRFKLDLNVDIMV